MQNIGDMMALLALWRPATGDYRFTIPQLGRVLGADYLMPAAKDALRAKCLALGATYIGKGRVYDNGKETMKDNVYSVKDAPALWQGLTGQHMDAPAPQPAPRPEPSPDSMAQRLRRIEAKLDTLLRLAGNDD